MQSTTLLWIALLGACSGTDGKPVTTKAGSPTDTAVPTTTEPLPEQVAVSVTLDGMPAADVVVRQGGASTTVHTDAAGQALLPIDAAIDAPTVIASHPEARTAVHVVDGPTATLALTRFSQVDNEAYAFDHPGTPTDRGDASKCGHCHNTIDDDWYDSAHRSSASNSRVQDIYAGVSTSLSTAEDCAAAGGQWWQGLEPGTQQPVDRCYVGSGTLPDLNPDCGVASPCDGVATQTGACADCHAPGMDGVQGGRDLLQATGHGYAFGVFCDVCHKVESVDLGLPPGTGGRLRILRPSDPSPSPGFEYWPLTFGPWGDVGNPRMGGTIQRDHYQDGTLCAGCHELEQAVLVPGEAADPARWPSGTLPIHTTWSEWLAGPMNPGSPCQACHMPPDADAGNAADLYNVFDAPFGEGIATGWARPPGSVRRHVWVGPRSPQVQDMLGLAADVTLAGHWEGTDWVVDATVRNVGPGHAIPTGEPSRHLLLAVEATCQGAPLAPIGGDVLPDYAGAYDTQDAAGDWLVWPGAQVGDRIRVVGLPGGFVDYTGYGPFGDGTFAPDQKGLPVEVFAGERTVTAVAGDTVTLDGPLPIGDRAYRVPPAALPVDGDPITALAGAPGFGFARVLAGATGERMVPHHAAVDVVSDNRLLPQTQWTSTHRFDGTGCAQPTTEAVLVHRAFPWAEAAEKAWTVPDSVMTGEVLP